MIQDAILNYIDHLEDEAYFTALLGANETHELIQILVDLLRSEDAERVSFTCLFIRDLLCIAPRYQLGLAFRAAFFISALVLELERLVLAKHYSIRHEAIYTLGKTGSTRSIPALHRAFKLFRASDPLLLPRLISEIWWLESDQRSWELIDVMLASPLYLTRWAVLGILTTWSGEGAIRAIQQQCYAALRFDEYPLIRAEATYEYQQFLFEQRLPALTKTEKRKQRKEIDRYKPALSFADVEVKFGNYMFTNNLATYSLDELDQFITSDVPQ